MPPECPDPTCRRTAEHVHLTRLLLPLPSAVPLRDGYAHRVDRLEDGVPVTSYLALRRAPAASGTNRQLRRTADGHGLELPRSDAGRAAGTVADIITPSHRPAAAGTRDARASEGELLERALDAVAPIVRAVRLIGGGKPVVVPTPELLPGRVARFEAVVTAGADWTARDVAWSRGTWLSVEHAQGPDEEDVDSHAVALARWGAAVREGAPLVPARELALEAEHLIHRRGDHATGVTLLWAACEALLDAVASVAWWERSLQHPDRLDAAGAAQLFAEGTPAQRARRHLPGILAGNWSSPNAPWTLAVRDVQRPRDRLVLGGRTPSRTEAEAALAAAAGLREFLADRVARRGDRFPRTALLLGDPTARRGLAPLVEGHDAQHWQASWRAWHDELVARLTP